MEHRLRLYPRKQQQTKKKNIAFLKSIAFPKIDGCPTTTSLGVFDIGRHHYIWTPREKSFRSNWKRNWSPNSRGHVVGSTRLLGRGWWGNDLIDWWTYLITQNHSFMYCSYAVSFIEQEWIFSTCCTISAIYEAIWSIPKLIDAQARVLASLEMASRNLHSPRPKQFHIISSLKCFQLSSFQHPFVTFHHTGLLHTYLGSRSSSIKYCGD